jgi:hypothetical protein
MSAGGPELELSTVSTFVPAVEAGEKNSFTPNPATRATAIATIWWTRIVQPSGE